MVDKNLEWKGAMMTKKYGSEARPTIGDVQGKTLTKVGQKFA